MPELRKDPIVGRWVIIAHERAKRPHDFKAEAHEPGRAAGSARSARARRTRRRPRSSPIATSARRPNGPGWRIRVVPNKFPALKIEGNLNKRGDGIYDMMAGVGAHEVIIESPRHHTSMATLTEDNIREVLWVYRDRLVDLKKDTRLVHGMLFKNVGEARRGQPRAHAQPADRHADRADLGLGGDDRRPGVLQLPRPLHLLRHDPAGARRREADRPRHDPLHRVLPLRQPVPVRDLDRPQDPLQPLREHPQAGRRRPGHTSSARS